VFFDNVLFTPGHPLPGPSASITAAQLTATISLSFPSGSKALERLRTNTGLQLKVEENESGFSLLLMDGFRVKEMLGFSSSKSGIYTTFDSQQGDRSEENA
jgi:hypothetical protein